MHKLNPANTKSVSEIVKEYLWSDYKPRKCTTSYVNNRFYIISCGQDGGDVTVNEFADEAAFIAAIDKQIELMLESEYHDEKNADDWLLDAVYSAEGSGYIVSVSLWG